MFSGQNGIDIRLADREARLPAFPNSAVPNPEPFPFPVRAEFVITLNEWRWPSPLASPPHGRLARPLSPRASRLRVRPFKMKVGKMPPFPSGRPAHSHQGKRSWSVFSADSCRNVVVPRFRGVVESRSGTRSDTRRGWFAAAAGLRGA